MSDETPLQRLEAHPGFSLATGLATVNGRRESLERLIQRYAELHAGDLLLFREHLAAGQLDEVRRLAHTLRGSAGFLGLAAIQQVCGDLELATLPGGDPAALPTLVASFGLENSLVCGAIQGAGVPLPV
jgi:HPt (histidine-containing phosphotransfer) domain-containing protein